MKIRIPRDELKVGMFIDRAVLESTDKSKAGVNFIRNLMIDSPEKLAELQKQKIKFLIIDTTKAQKIEPKKDRRFNIKSKYSLVFPPGRIPGTNALFF